MVGVSKVVVWYKISQIVNLFPALAGVILRGLRQSEIVEPFPRMSGGDPAFEFALSVASTFSPRERG